MASDSRKQEPSLHNEDVQHDPQQDPQTGELEDSTSDGELTENQPPLPSEPTPPLPSEEAPPLPDEAAPPPLPTEAPPSDDGWEPVWDDSAQAFYFYNRHTKQTQWENPRVPDTTTAATPLPTTLAPGLGSHDRIPPSSSTGKSRAGGGYNPAIHGDYDPQADYAIGASDSEEERVVENGGQTEPGLYEATGAFNRFTGKWQKADLNPENFTDESKSKRQMSAFFDVDSAANAHDGRSLRAERQNKKFSRKEIKAFKEKRREKKEEKRRAWLRD